MTVQHKLGKRARQARCFAKWLGLCLDHVFEGLPLYRLLRLRHDKGALKRLQTRATFQLLDLWPRPLQPMMSIREQHLAFKRHVDRHLILRHRGVKLPITKTILFLMRIDERQADLRRSDKDLAMLPVLSAIPSALPRTERIVNTLMQWLNQTFLLGEGACSMPRTELLSEANEHLRSLGMPKNVLNRNGASWRLFLKRLGPRTNPSNYRRLRLHRRPSPISTAPTL